MEDNPNHDWTDYRVNWESTLVASLLQPDVWHYEVAPWPERVFAGKYPARAGSPERSPIPPAYATELQTVMNALNDLDQPQAEWASGTTGLGVLVSDSLMFERGGPSSSDEHMGSFYGLAMPLVKRGMPVTPVQLENIDLPKYLNGFHVLLLTYQGMKPLTAQVHEALADWVNQGGVLVMADDDSDPFNAVREWWNSNGLNFATPRLHLFAQLGLENQPSLAEATPRRVGKGAIVWLRRNPVEFTANAQSEAVLVEAVKKAVELSKSSWREANHLLLRRGPYVVAAGLEESVQAEPPALSGRFVNLLDPELAVRTRVTVAPGSRYFLLDLSRKRGSRPMVLASACRSRVTATGRRALTMTVEGVEDTAAIVLVYWPGTPPRAATLAGKPLDVAQDSASDHLVWLRFTNRSQPRELRLSR